MDIGLVYNGGKDNWTLVYGQNRIQLKSKKRKDILAELLELGEKAPDSTIAIINLLWD